MRAVKKLIDPVVLIFKVIDFLSIEIYPNLVA